MDMSHDIDYALQALREGKTLVYPTDTVWGLGCDAENSAAVARVFAIKHRPDAKSMLLLAADIDMVSHYVDSIPADMSELLQDLKRPTTIIYSGAHGVDARLIAADGSIGIRIPTRGFALELCRRFGRPIVSTSANLSGQPTPMSYGDIPATILRNADYVCSSGRESEPVSAPSDILKIDPAGAISVIRQF